MRGESAAGLPVAVLAGGRGMRLAGAVRDRPKPMAEVAGRPFLEWLLRYLRSLGFARFVLCTGHMAGAVEDHFGDGSRLGSDIGYSRETSPLGTAGALRRALGVLDSRAFFAVNGDSLCEFDPDAMAAAHAAGALVTMWLVPSVGDAGRFGTVDLESDGTVARFREKDPSGGRRLVSAGVYLMERALLEPFGGGEALSLERDVFPSLPPGAMRGVVGTGPLLDIGTPESLASARVFAENNPRLFEGSSRRGA